MSVAASITRPMRSASQRAGTLPPEMPIDVRLMNRATRWVLVLTVLVVLALALIALARQPWFNFGRIRIEGELTRSSLATVRANAAPKLAGNFFTMDLRSARQAFESVPWVRKAVVRRSWPGTLVVRLEEHRAAALWQSIEGGVGAAEDRLVNQQGELFQANTGDVEDESLPVFKGPDSAASQMLSMYRALTPVLAPLRAAEATAGDARAASSIASLQLSTRGSWSVLMDSGTQIELGRGGAEEVVERSRRFVRTLAQATAPYRRPLVFADLRHNDGYAIRLAGITTNPAAALAPGRQR